jgi:hypothetical protein
MPADKGVTRHALAANQWLAVKGVMRIVGIGGDGAFLVETKPLPSRVRVRRMRREIDKRGPPAQ